MELEYQVADADNCWRGETMLYSTWQIRVSEVSFVDFPARFNAVRARNDVDVRRSDDKVIKQLQ